MDELSLIKISLINDFIFCPRSIYFHNLYSDLNENMYHTYYQKRGKLNHESIDKKSYSSSKNIIKGIDVFSENLGIIGKIDLYFKDKFLLMERKYYISKIYDGYLYQIYAQYFCMIEMGYIVKKLVLYSFKDNKKYDIKLPTDKERNELKFIISKIRIYNIFNEKVKINPNKCKKCIYRNVCDLYKNDE